MATTPETKTTLRVKFDRSPPIPYTTEFSTVQMIRRAIIAHDSGQFRRSSILFERMNWNARVRAAFDTRGAGHLSAEIRWEPSQNNRAARRAAKEIREDFPTMAPHPQRRQLLKAGLGMGLGLAQRVPMQPRPNGRQLFRLRPYWTGWSEWRYHEDAYRIQCRDGKHVDVKSPLETALSGDPFASSWLIHEPFGELSFREALLHALGRTFYAHESSDRDLGRASEKFGVGMAKLMHPTAAELADVRAIRGGFDTAGSESVVPLPTGTENADGSKIGGWDLVPFEYTGSNGVELILQSLNTAAIAFAILILGHNLTTEVKGGSYAAASVGDFIRTDKKYEDAYAEAATLRPQLLMPWAQVNYGDPDLAPIPIYVVDPPAVNKARAETIKLLSESLRELSTLTQVDGNQLVEQFQLPILPPGVVQVQVPAAAAPNAPAKDPAEPETEPSDENVVEPDEE